MSVWETYPSDYRNKEVEIILHAVCAGECVAIVGLSGSGKSNLVGFIANRVESLPSVHEIISIRDCPRFVAVDCNRLVEPTPLAFFRLLRRTLDEGVGAGLGEDAQTDDALAELGACLARKMHGGEKICALLDRFDALFGQEEFSVIASNLRALRDMYKYQLTYVIAIRRPLDSQTELAELFFGHTLWLGPLSKQNAMWSARRDAGRFAGNTQVWGEQALNKLVELTWGYPSLLRAACEAYAGGAKLDLETLSKHPSITRRVDEFWVDQPDQEALQLSGLLGQPLLEAGRRDLGGKARFDTSMLTAKENLLLEFLMAHAGKVCDKDDLIRAVWPEDIIYEQGVRDDSLAQLVRRLRVKIEHDPSEPLYIQTVPGRGYLLRE